MRDPAPDPPRRLRRPERRPGRLHRLEAREALGPAAARHGLDRWVSEVTDCKPAAHVFVDDRAVCFRGDYGEALKEIAAFRAHWE